MLPYKLITSYIYIIIVPYFKKKNNLYGIVRQLVIMTKRVYDEVDVILSIHKKMNKMKYLFLLQ